MYLPAIVDIVSIFLIKIYTTVKIYFSWLFNKEIFFFEIQY